MNRSATSHALWILAAAVFGFASAFVFADLLALPRAWFLVPHVALTLGFLGAYARWSGTGLRALARRWAWGLLGMAVVAVFLVKNVLGQPASPTSTGLAFWGDVLWLGLVYGAIDGLLLSAMPLAAAWSIGERLGWTSRWSGRLGAALLGLAASALITATYHAGYAEFRGPRLRLAITGNVVMSVGQLVTTSPVTSVGSHMIMHVAAVVHGPDTTVQMPPHQNVTVSTAL